MMNRRRFLAASALAGTWSMMPPFARAQTPLSEVRVGVIGLNGRGANHIEELLKVKAAKLVAICDCDSDVLDRTKAKLEKAGVKVKTFTDFRQMLEGDLVDAVTIATPNHTHCYIAITSVSAGKPVYVEKPVSHNIWEGRMLATAQKKTGKIIQHGFQRRSEKAWEDAFKWLNSGDPIGKLKLARGICYKPRPSIGKVAEPNHPPASVDYDLWSGPRELLPVMREKFHYDWHWQFPYGNGDLGNQGPHQLDVCRWAIGDPQKLPAYALSCGGRFGYQDDGQWANTQIVFLGYDPVPILFEVRGLPAKDMNYKGGMDKIQGQDVGNILEYEGGMLIGGHSAACHVVDQDGKVMKEFKGSGPSHFETWVQAVISGKQETQRAAESGHVSSALAHLGNISWRIGGVAPLDKIREGFSHPAAAEAVDRMEAHLAANGVDVKTSGFTLGGRLETVDGGEEFRGDSAEKANALLKDSYRSGYEIVV